MAVLNRPKETYNYYKSQQKKRNTALLKTKKDIWAEIQQLIYEYEFNIYEYSQTKLDFHLDKFAKDLQTVYYNSSYWWSSVSVSKKKFTGYMFMNKLGNKIYIKKNKDEILIYIE